MSLTILIVDDSSVDRIRLESLLSAAGYTTTMAVDGQQAIDIAKRTKPHVILMDITMPEMDGYAATRVLKSDDQTKAIPVVMVSVKNSKADRAWSQMLGAHGHVGKPFSDDEMLQQLKALH